MERFTIVFMKKIESLWKRVRVNSIKGDQVSIHLWRDLHLLYLSLSNAIKDSTSSSSNFWMMGAHQDFPIVQNNIVISTPSLGTPKIAVIGLVLIVLPQIYEKAIDIPYGYGHSQNMCPIVAGFRWHLIRVGSILGYNLDSFCFSEM